MLKINNTEFEITSADIKFANSTYNQKIVGYEPLISIKFTKNNVNGFIEFFLGFTKENDFSNLSNKKIKSNPRNLDAVINCVEIFDTQKFMDFIDSDITVIFGDINDNKIKTKIIIDDDMIKVEFDGVLSITK